MRFDFIYDKVLSAIKGAPHDCFLISKKYNILGANNMRQNTQPFFVTKDYSEIPGLQTSSRDTYEVLSSDGYIIIRYTSIGNKGTVSEEKRLNSVSFNDAKNIAVFLSENNVRKSAWMEIVNDLCG